MSWPLHLVVAAGVASAWFVLGAAPGLHKVEASRMSMACLYSIVAYGDRPDAVARTLDAALDEVDRVDQLMSHYREDSPLSRINREAARAAVTVDPELFDFIAAALAYSVESGGAFDVTVGPLMKAWGFFRGDGRFPTEAELSRARSATGVRHVTLNAADRTIRFDREGVELDLGGIAKGYAVDRAIGILKRDGITAALVSAGGSTIYALGKPPERAYWTVDIQDPLEARKVAFSVPLQDRALSVSGVSEKSFERDGVRYAHIMDPRTGRPARGVLGVIVQAPSGTAGDAIDNILFVQGVERGRAFLRRHPDVEASFLLPGRNGGWNRVIVSAVSPPPPSPQIDDGVSREDGK
jgi:thiamine biosynthesis lipoprotein